MLWFPPPSHSFARLRSFHLRRSFSPKPTVAQFSTSVDLKPSYQISFAPSHVINRQKHEPAPLTPRKSYPLPSAAYTWFLVLVSLIFIESISLSFVGQSREVDPFKDVLNQVAEETPGLVFIGESVDVDIDEPSVAVRWAVLGCGNGQYLSGSTGVHGSDQCGLPAQSLSIFIDGAKTPSATYDPSLLPFDSTTSQRRSIQNLVQFDIDYVLDVHRASLYPFDSYFLSGTMRAADSNNRTTPISKIVATDSVTSFVISTTDFDSVSSLNGSSQATRDFDMHIRRPNGHRAIVMLIFTVNWMLAHCSLVIIASKRRRSRPRYLLCIFGILFFVSKLRDNMPDAPGLDGILLDTIGLFPQVIIISASALIMFIIFLAEDHGLDSRVSRGVKQRLRWTGNSPSGGSFVFPRQKSNLRSLYIPV